MEERELGHQPLAGSVGHSLPLVSVVTPSFNQGKFLEETIQSVLNQDYPNLEYIIIDGRSTDNSVDIIRKYAHRLSYWVSEPDDGQADAIGKGFLRSTGAIMAWLNSDDMYLPGAVSTAVAALQRYPKVDLIYGDVFIIDEHGAELGERLLTPLDRYDFLGHGNCLAQPATFWRRSVYNLVGGINTSYYYQMDLDLYVRIAAAGRIKHLRRHFAKIRMHPEGKMVKAEDVRQADLAQLQQQYVTATGLRRLLYSRRFLLPRLFLRYAMQGDLLYAGRKVWQGLRSRKLNIKP